MDILELKNIAESYGLKVLYNKNYDKAEAYFEDYPNFWDKYHISSNVLVSIFLGKIVVYTSLVKDYVSGKYVLSGRKTYQLKDYPTNELYNLINRITKSIKNELFKHKVSNIEKDF